MPDNFCPSCGAPARSGARFCPSCGQAAGSGPRPAPTPAPAPLPAAWPAPFPAARPPRPGARLIAQGAVLTLLTIVVGAVGLVSVRRMGESAQALYAEGVQGLEAAAMGEVFAAQRATLRDMCTDTDPGVNQAQKEQMDAGRAILLRSAKQLQESSRGHPEKKAMVDEVAKAMEAYFNVADEAVRLAMANRNAEAVQWLRTVAAPANNGFRQGLTRLKVFMRDRAEDQMEKNEAASRASMMALALCLAVAVALGLATSALLAAAKH